MMQHTKTPHTEETKTLPQEPKTSSEPETSLPKEYGGQKGPNPTRYGDWENGGRCTDF